uniref:Uncharacterized protein n=1 Tax=viral metagenome TaxID=1070528 RepID=A0A6C0HUM5_9ZZZZ
MGCGCNKKEEVKVEKLVKNSKLETFANHCNKNKGIIGFLILILIIIFLFMIFKDNKNNGYLVLPRGSIVGRRGEYTVDLSLSPSSD